MSELSWIQFMCLLFSCTVHLCVLSNVIIESLCVGSRECFKFIMYVFCEVCKTTLSSVNDMTPHENGKRHRRNILRFPNLIHENGSTNRAGVFQIIKEDSSEQVLPSNNANPPLNTAQTTERQVTKTSADNLKIVVRRAEEGAVRQTGPPMSGGVRLFRRQDHPPPFGQPSRENPVTQFIKTLWKPNQGQLREQPGKRKLAKEEDPKTEVPPVQLDYETSFDQQVRSLISQLEMTYLQRGDVQKVLRDICIVFRPVLPSFTPLIYGSTLTDLAFKTSDIDIYICINDGRPADPRFVQRDGRAIYRWGLFRNIVRIPRARVPVIKAVHAETGRALDISLTSGHAVTNSLLLRFLHTSVPRLRQLLMLLAFWAKTNNIIGVSRFSRYALNLMAIFYLQNIQPPMFPPLRVLLDESVGNPWPVSFKEDSSRFDDDGKIPLSVLFIDFFKFFNEFDFTKYFISTYLGEKVEKEDFLKNQEKYYKMMPRYEDFVISRKDRLKLLEVCVQDPFELHLNVTKQVTPKILQFFKAHCQAMLSIKTSLPEKYWLREIIIGVKVEEPPKERKVNEFSFEVKKPLAEEWQLGLKTDLEKILLALKFKIDWDIPAEKKRLKTEENHIQLILENHCHPTSKKFKGVLNSVKAGIIDIDEYIFLTEKMYQDIIKESRQPIFCASLEVTKLSSDKLLFTLRHLKGEPGLVRSIYIGLRFSMPFFLEASSKTEKKTITTKLIPDKDSLPSEEETKSPPENPDIPTPT